MNNTSSLKTEVYLMPESEYWPFTNGRAVEDVTFKGESSLLQKQLGDMEGEVKEIQMELASIRRDRLDLYNRKQARGFDVEDDDVVRDTPSDDEPLNKIQGDNQVAKLREDLIRAKNTAEEEKFQREKYEDKLKDLELKLNNLCCTGIVAETKESRKISDMEVASLKTQLRDMKDEMEEMKITVTEKNEQLQDYRVKYLQAQQQVEELRRQLDIIEFDNKQVSDQIQIEIQKMKMQFQEKLQELAPLPDLLKGAQIQLQEAKQLQKLAEDSSQQLSNEFHRVKEKLLIAVNSFNQEKVEKTKVIEENNTLKITVDEQKKEIDDFYKTVDDYKCKVLRLQEKLSQLDTRFNEKAAECAALIKGQDELRMETNRSLSRSKERADSMRRYLQTQISELERQLIQSRAQCRACQKERDEIRQRMQIQINNLQESFELVEIRLRALQNQVISLKSSYSVILDGESDCREFNKITS